jgi:hypothetical protein
LKIFTSGSPDFSCSRDAIGLARLLLAVEHEVELAVVEARTKIELRELLEEDDERHRLPLGLRLLLRGLRFGRRSRRLRRGIVLRSRRMGALL